ncbi:ribosomal-protein-alanine N-acetyltransferase [Alkalibacillus filiformis]|uniref:Ribosomal-protein-alanine N-acetyltransferase n=1 Tax=Alkalibacillus filiformis TaxID=200990 RepID=A0ABU0DPT0_9BACI|nr:GNAT family N-acetyltransferase [Alkalibacillus filiformis]MDQ0350375.1 ribosomal-protein-alanine N-acetyltransferase [Alkalibacillus filiformis]
MSYQIKVMTQKQAEDIAFNWRYDGEYSFYDMVADEEDLSEFVDPESRGKSTYAVMSNNDLIGFFSVNKVYEHTYDIGLGMKPDLTGKGNGLKFLNEGIKFVIQEFEAERITLSVATFNQRAINLYKKVGFKEINIFMQETNDDCFEFQRMEYECRKGD